MYGKRVRKGKRERFLRECGRMVGAYPELEEEVRWRLDHVMTKWEMLTQLRTKSKNNLLKFPRSNTIKVP